MIPTIITTVIAGVNTLLILNCAACIFNGNELRAMLFEQMRCPRANITKPLNSIGCPLQFEFLVFCPLLNTEDNTLPGRLVTTKAPTSFNWFSRDP